MIIISMGEGLGNQMFEYAFYTHIKKQYPNQEIKVDTTYAFEYIHNGIEIFDVFHLKTPPIAMREEVLKLARGYLLYGQGFEKKTIPERLIGKSGYRPQSMVIQKDRTEYYENFFELDPDKSYYFFGVFANYHYFKAIENEVRLLYQFPEIEDDRNKAYATQIKNCNAVSIHIRKGDYVKFGIQLTPKSFYDEAIKMIEEKTDEALYYVFTDDPHYARELFPDEKRFTVVEGNTGRYSFRDMQLMSMCRHNITANSTFSFWGAFLNPNKNKMVIAPNLPFTGLKCPFVCDDWILI